MTITNETCIRIQLPYHDLTAKLACKETTSLFGFIVQFRSGNVWNRSLKAWLKNKDSVKKKSKIAKHVPLNVHLPVNISRSWQE